jgi:Glycosyltransferase family 87
VVGVLLIGSAVATALLVAVAARLTSLASTLLLAYLALVANLALTTLVLSPFRDVTRAGLAVAEGAMLLAALAFWWGRGRPAPPLHAARTAARSLLTDGPTMLFLVAIAALLAYEAVLGLAVPPNNGDALAYHLAKAAAWAQHGGIYWIPNAPSVRINEFQPLGEQQLLFLLVATGGGRLVAIPQLLAEGAILVAVYATSRRLGFDPRRSAGAALLLATFSLLALESTTAQNDLVAASFPAAAAALLLGPGLLEPGLAGAAAGIGLGAKLTTMLVLPVLGWLALTRGRRALLVSAAGLTIGLAALGMWGYVLNLDDTGHLLGVGTGPVEDRASPSYPGSLANAFYLLYGLMDLSVLSHHLIDLLAVAGTVAAVGAAARAFRSRGSADAAAEGASVALPFLAPLLVVGGAGVLAFLARSWGFPIRGPGGILMPIEDNLNETYTRIANEDYSAFGPIGIVALVAASALAIAAYIGKRADARQLALASALPSFLILAALGTSWNPFLIRFFLVPAVLAAPLLAHLFRGPATVLAYLVAAGIVVGLTVTNDQAKPLSNPYGFGRPWNLTVAHALATNSRVDFAASIDAYNSAIPPRACVGAILDSPDPAYYLFGQRLQHRVVYLPLTNPVPAALASGLFYVVINAPAYNAVAGQFQAAGWRVRPLGPAWLLASEPNAGSGACR